MMKVIGLTGGVGSGKSRALAYLRETYHAVICQADQTAWKLQEPREACYRAIVAQFGDGILQKDGTIDRKILGQIVFADRSRLQALNGILHPAVRQRIRGQIAEEAGKGTRLFVLEAALLVEEHYDEICDELWYIYTDEQIRRQRLKASRPYEDERIDAIMASQLSEDEFRRACRRVIDNSGPFEKTCLQLDEAVRRLEEDIR